MTNHKLRPLALTSLVLAITAFILTSRVAAAPLPAAAGTVPSRPSPSAGANGRVSAIARAGDRIYIGGAFTAVDGQPRGGLAALDAATGQLIPWRADVSGGPVEALAASPDGATLYLGGDFSGVAGTARRRLAAVSTASGKVTAWNPGASGGVVLALAADAEHVWTGGKFTTIAKLGRPYLAALSPSGAGAALAWNPRSDNAVRALALALDGGRLYAAGDFHSIAGRAQRFLAALDTGGGNDAGWHPQATCPGLGLTVAAGSAYMVCGGASASGGNSVLAYSASTGAQRWIGRSDGDIHGVAWINGVVYAGGHFTIVNGASRKKAAAFDAASGALLAWDPHPDSSLGVFSMLASGDWLWMGGDFTKVAGISQPHVARFGPAGATTATQIGFANPTLGGPAQRFREALPSFTP